MYPSSHKKKFLLYVHQVLTIFIYSFYTPLPYHSCYLITSTSSIHIPNQHYSSPPFKPPSVLIHIIPKLSHLFLSHFSHFLMYNFRSCYFTLPIFFSTAHTILDPFHPCALTPFHTLRDNGSAHSSFHLPLLFSSMPHHTTALSIPFPHLTSFSIINFTISYLFL